MTVRWPARSRFGAVLLTWAACCAVGAQAPPHIGYVYPAGLQRGTVGEIVLGGSGLRRTVEARFSAPGVSAEVVARTRPMTSKERATARDKLAQLRRRRDQLNDAEREELATLQKELARDARARSNPQLGETVVLRVAVAADAGLGEIDLRVRTATLFSNPIRFEIGELPELREPDPELRDAPRETRIEPPVVVNGQILPGQRDRFRLRMARGEQLVAAVRARTLIPYLADAVPGWFQATLALYDQAGVEVAFADDHWFAPDPLLRYEAPDDGDYVLEIRDAIYRGREDFVYRIEVADARGSDVGVTAVDVGSATLERASLAMGRLPVSAEREPNDSLDQAQRVTLPRLIDGVIGAPNDRDVFAFAGRAGDRLVVEVLARRLGSPLDSLIRITDPFGREIARNDDCDDPGAGLITHCADSWLTLLMSADGVYRVHLSDVQCQGGAEFTYRLRIDAPRPDFALRLVPSAVSMVAGGTVAFTVHALRYDGFDGEIRLETVDQPGFRLDGFVPAGAEIAQVTLTAPGRPTRQPVALAVEGVARIRGGEVRRRAVAAEDVMQAFAYRHLVPAHEFLCQVNRGASAVGSLTVPSDRPVRLPLGRVAELSLDCGGNRSLPAKVQLVVRDPADGIEVTGADRKANRVMLQLRVEESEIEVGAKGNLIIDAYVAQSVPARGGAQTPSVRRRLIGTLPAIPFEIVRR